MFNWHSPRPDAVTASRPSVRTADSLDSLRDRRILARAESRNTWKCDTAITALGRSSGLFEVVVDETPAGGLHNAPTVGCGVVRSTLADRNTLGHCGCYKKNQSNQ